MDIIAKRLEHVMHMTSYVQGLRTGARFHCYFVGVLAGGAVPKIICISHDCLSYSKINESKHIIVHFSFLRLVPQCLNTPHYEHSECGAKVRICDLCKHGIKLLFFIGASLACQLQD